MRFVHTADLHIGRRLAQISLADDMEHVLRELKDLVVQSGAQALVVAGDVFDSPNPAESAARQWDRFITDMATLDVPVLVVSGNHDSGARLAVGSNLMARAGVHIAGELTEEIEPVVVAGVNFWLIPFVRRADVRAWARSLGRVGVELDSTDDAVRLVLDHVRSRPDFPLRPNVCVAHQFVWANGSRPETSDSEQLSLGTLDNVDYTAFDGFDYVALGHLHGPQRVGRDTCRYAGSPLKYSSSEANHHKSFCVVGIKQTEEGTRVKFRLREIEPLRDLRRVRGGVDELVEQAHGESERRRDDFIHAVVTDDDAIDVVARLRNVWKNLLQVTFDNATTRNAQNQALSSEVDITKDMDDLFREFFEAQCGRGLSREEEHMVRIAFERAAKRGVDA